MTTSTIDWTGQQQASLQRSMAGGGKQIATADARIEDEAGKLYAHATTTCFVFDVPTT
ncbi:hotdog family protein [Halopseudomonas salegens]|uniref:hypothetical protein n=1 Tax=Halopseudomonas salegens TaxID=1434072 RepID=UPI000A850C5C|nr:hypothetical protein [Halopseudomonas salegens]